MDKSGKLQKSLDGVSKGRFCFECGEETDCITKMYDGSGGEPLSFRACQKCRPGVIEMFVKGAPAIELFDGPDEPFRVRILRSNEQQGAADEIRDVNDYRGSPGRWAEMTVLAKNRFKMGLCVYCDEKNEAPIFYLPEDKPNGKLEDAAFRLPLCAEHQDAHVSILGDEADGMRSGGGWDAERQAPTSAGEGLVHSNMPHTWPALIKKSKKRVKKGLCLLCKRKGTTSFPMGTPPGEKWPDGSTEFHIPACGKHTQTIADTIAGAAAYQQAMKGNTPPNMRS